MTRDVGGTRQTLRIQTVDTRADGVTPTTREATNARLIQEAFPRDVLILIPKTTRPGAPFSPTLTYDQALGDILELGGL